jgi:hypothetical protein
LLFLFGCGYGNLLRSMWRMPSQAKGMYNGREGTPSLSTPFYLEKIKKISDRMHYLL